MELTERIARAPWREAVTYRDTWPHEYVLYSLAIRISSASPVAV